MAQTMGMNNMVDLGNTMNIEIRRNNRAILQQNSINRSNYINERQGESELSNQAQSLEYEESGKDRLGEALDVAETIDSGKYTSDSVNKLFTKTEKPQDISPNIVPEGERVVPAYSVKESMPSGSLYDSYQDRIQIPSEVPQKDVPVLEHSPEDPVVSATFDADKMAGAGSDVGKLSVGLKGVSGVMGGYDLVKDIVSPAGTFGKMNTADKISNVSGIASGVAVGLEGVGAVLDATGVGALAGVPLQVLGAGVEAVGLVSGAIGAGSGVIGDVQDEQTEQAQVDTDTSKLNRMSAPNLIKPIAGRSLFQSGVVEGGVSRGNYSF